MQALLNYTYPGKHTVSWRYLEYVLTLCSDSGLRNTAHDLCSVPASGIGRRIRGFGFIGTGP